MGRTAVDHDVAGACFSREHVGFQAVAGGDRGDQHFLARPQIGGGQWKSTTANNSRRKPSQDGNWKAKIWAVHPTARSSCSMITPVSTITTSSFRSRSAQ